MLRRETLAEGESARGAAGFSRPTAGRRLFHYHHQALGAGLYRLTGAGAGPDESRRVVEEIVRLPDLATGVITSDRDGLHPDFDDEAEELAGGFRILQWMEEITH